MGMNRREFVGGALGAGALLPSAAVAQPPVPIIDTHIHLFDSRRPQGAAWAGGRGYGRPAALPADYRAIAQPLGIVGAIKVEASAWMEDNLWVLETIGPDPFMVGTIGNLRPEQAEFAEYLGRYQKNPLFLGIRQGTNWGYEIAKQADNPVFIEGLRLLAKSDLTFESANPRIDLFQAIVKISDRVPELRIVLDHIPLFHPTAENEKEYGALLQEFAGRKQIYCKLSQIIHRERLADGTQGAMQTSLAPHKEWLDRLMRIFGEDRVIFGSDWPSSVFNDTLPTVVSVAKEYFATRSRAAQEKYFWRNSVAAYKWKPRMAAQPRVT
jgi:predicted TIM-barrel fold metal-dependent hydrolase